MKDNMMNQCMLVLKHLQKQPITTHDAVSLYGITRLPSRIFDLRSSGLDIQDRWAYGYNRYGRYVKWKEYFLKK